MSFGINPLQDRNMSKLDKQKIKERMSLKIRKSFELEGIYFTDEEFEKYCNEVVGAKPSQYD